MPPSSAGPLISQAIPQISEPKSEEEEESHGGGSAPTNIGDCTLPDVRPDFEPDGAANLGSVLLQAMLSEKELTGFPKNYETPGQPKTTGDADNEVPTDDDWKNL